MTSPHSNSPSLTPEQELLEKYVDRFIDLQKNSGTRNSPFFVVKMFSECCQSTEDIYLLLFKILDRYSREFDKELKSECATAREEGRMEERKSWIDQKSNDHDNQIREEERQRIGQNLDQGWDRFMTALWGWAYNDLEYWKKRPSASAPFYSENTIKHAIKNMVFTGKTDSDSVTLDYWVQRSEEFFKTLQIVKLVRTPPEDGGE